MASLWCALAEPMKSHARRFIAYLLLAVFSAATVPGVGLHCLFELSLPHGDGLSHCSAACAHIDRGHNEAEPSLCLTVPDDACPVCQFLGKWQSPDLPRTLADVQERVALIDAWPLLWPPLPIHSAYLPRAPPHA